MLNRFPNQPPELSELLTDALLGQLTNTQLAKRFGVSERTFRRWKDHGAPVAVRLALWSISLQGLDTLQCESDNALALYRGLAGARANEMAALQREIQRLLRLGDFGAANDATQMSAQRAPALYDASKARRARM